MTYEEARDFITKSNQFGSVLGLETITELLLRLGHPEDKLKIIHVAGTNGKGSTSAFLTSILSHAGYRVGRYISPTVFSYRERIQITDRSVSNDAGYITREGVCRTLEIIQPICEAMVVDGFAHPTSFEIETAMTFLYLMWESVDFLVLEVGLGGRLDATNAIRYPILSVITSISMDHMQYLGNTLTKIAGEKAGIIKSKVPVITCNQELEVQQVLNERTKEQNTELTIADTSQAKDISYSLDGTNFTYGGQTYRIGLLGKYQLKNAVLALETAKVLGLNGYPIGEEAIFRGLMAAKWSGRFEVISHNPTLVIDGAHNEDAARMLKESMEIYFAKQRRIFIIGMLADKDYQNILRLTAPFADMVFTLTPDNTRALSSEMLAMEARRYCNNVYDARSVEQALKLAIAEAGVNGVVIAFGSLSFLGDLVTTFNVTKG